MIKISKEKVLLLHQLIAEETGGSIGLRDVGLLESALSNAYATFGGEELYKTKEEKAASLGFSLTYTPTLLFPSTNAWLDISEKPRLAAFSSFVL